MNRDNRYYLTLADLEIDPIENLKKQLTMVLPGLFENDILDLEILGKALTAKGIVVENKHFFGLQWPKRGEARIKINEPVNDQTLLPVRAKSLNFDQAQNVIIEGDNLQVLKLLTKAYFNQVDVIYIDPPYNTGNDFVYNDDFKQDSYEYKIANNLIDAQGLKTTTNQNNEARLHSDWLTMMYPRLATAKKLLSDNGVIFISIDHKEQARLRMLCDEIFHENNFVTCLTWVKKHGPGGNTSLDYKIVNNTEYILCYAKNINKVKFNYVVHDQKRLKELGYIHKDEYFQERGYYKLTHLYRPSSSGSFQYTQSLDYPIVAPDGTEFWLHCNKNGQPNGRYTWAYETYLAGQKLGFIECHKNENGDWVAFRKQYQFVKFDVKKKTIIKIKAGQPYENWIDDFYSQEGGSEIKELFGDKNTFDFPKPKRLIKHLLKMVSKTHSLVLDFFAGSGTTAQAVMELNQEDGGTRRYILVQLPEPIANNPAFQTICDVTRQRVERAITKYNYDDAGFKYFQLGPTNFDVWKVQSDDSCADVQQQLDIFARKTSNKNYEDILYELMLKYGLKLTWPIKHQIWNDHEFWIDDLQQYLFFLKPQVVDDIVSIITTICNSNSIVTVFIAETYFDQINGDEMKINLCEQIKQLNLNVKLWIV